MIKRLLSAAFVAGFLAAVVATALQLALTTPLILKAETFENQAGAAAYDDVPRLSNAVLGHGADRGFRSGLGVPVHEGHSHGEEAWQPGEGLPRMAFTGLATLIGGIGYALLLGALLLALRREPTIENGVAFGVAGFAAVSLAPAIGLPPELPGMTAAPLAARQIWWIATVLASGAGIYLIAVQRSIPAILAGLVLVATPHVWGAPHPHDAATRLPAELATQFAARSLAISFVFWTLIGAAFAFAWNLFGEKRVDA